MRLSLAPVIGWLLSASLSGLPGQSQYPSVNYRGRGAGAAQEEAARAEYELRRRIEAAYEARRARAHARLGSAAGTVAVESACPAFVGPSPISGTPDTNFKIAIRPFAARSAPMPRGPGWRGVAPPGESPSGLFTEYISDAVVQAKCVNCHVQGGVSGHTRLVLSPSSVEGHEALNFAVFENLVSIVDDAANLILNKIQGVGHGGGIQVEAGSADYANMERFLRLLGGETSSAGLSPKGLFDGVTMATPGRTLWRAALIFAGRLPSEAELIAVSTGREADLRRTIRGLMTGPGFHEFLVRVSNDRLLTDRHINHVNGVESATQWVGILNLFWEKAKEAADRGLHRDDYMPYRQLNFTLHPGIAGAPLELIAYVIENDLPYTEILTADYIMANPMSARGYGAETVFNDPANPNEFRPSRIVSYYGDHQTKITEDSIDLGTRVTNPGVLAVDYPHAGVLNTTVFLQRYPTTATNRNRARSRWVYYHFLGVDVEKSAARTTDSDALADTDNPTMKNPACTVCHSLLDPVAGAFQNYGEEGFYRDSFGGLDSLAGFYKRPPDGSLSPFQPGDTWYRDMRAPGFNGEVAPSPDNSLQWLAERIVADERFAEAAVRFWWPGIMGTEIASPPEDELDRDFKALLLGATAQSQEVKRIAVAFRSGIAGGTPFNGKDLLTEIALSPWFRAESMVAGDPIRNVALRDAGVERLLTPEELQRKTEAVTGYAWYRRHFRVQGSTPSRLNDRRHSLSDGSYSLLYGGIDSNGIVDRAVDVTPVMAAVAQTHALEVSCPVAMRELFLLPENERLLFGGIDVTESLSVEASNEFSIDAESWESRQTVSLSALIGPGDRIVRLTFTNPFYVGPGPGRHRVLNP